MDDLEYLLDNHISDIDLAIRGENLAIRDENLIIINKRLAIKITMHSFVSNHSE